MAINLSWLQRESFFSTGSSSSENVPSTSKSSDYVRSYLPTNEDKEQNTDRLRSTILLIEQGQSSIWKYLELYI